MGQSSDKLVHLNQIYQPNLNGYSRTNLNNLSNTNAIIWTHKFHTQQTTSLMEYHLQATSDQNLHQMEQIFEKRYNHQYLVASKAFHCTQKNQKNHPSGYLVRIFFQHIIANYSYLIDISIRDSLYFYSKAFQGFDILRNIYGCFKITEQMLYLNENAELKVWFDSDISKFKPKQSNLQSNINQSEMIFELIKIIDEKVSKNNNQLSIREQLIKRNSSTFIDTKLSLINICTEHQYKIPVKIESLSLISKSTLIDSFQKLQFGQFLSLSGLQSQMRNPQNSINFMKIDEVFRRNHKLSVSVSPKNKIKINKTNFNSGKKNQKRNKMSVLSSSKGNKFEKQKFLDKSIYLGMSQKLLTDSNIHPLGNKKRKNRKQRNQNELNQSNNMFVNSELINSQQYLYKSKTESNLLVNKTEDTSFFRGLSTQQNKNNSITNSDSFRLKQIQNNKQFKQKSNEIISKINFNPIIPLEKQRSNQTKNIILKSQSTNKNYNLHNNINFHKQENFLYDSSHIITRNNPLTFKNNHNSHTKNVLKKNKKSQLKQYNQKNQQIIQTKSNNKLLIIPKTVLMKKKQFLNNSLAKISQKSIQSQTIQNNLDYSIINLSNQNMKLNKQQQNISYNKIKQSYSNQFFNSEIDPLVMQNLLKIKSKYSDIIY